MNEYAEACLDDGVAAEAVGAEVAEAPGGLGTVVAAVAGIQLQTRRVPAEDVRSD